jgi:hypothetical protein
MHEPRDTPPAVKLCRKGLHPMTKANTLVQSENGRVRRRCLMCLQTYQQTYWHNHRKNPYRGPSLCLKGLHPMTPDNIMDRGDKGLVCRRCNRTWFKQVIAEGRYRRVRCAAPYCRHVSNRSVDRSDAFYCRDHRTGGRAA